MNKFILSIIVVGVCFGQDEADTTVTAPVDTTDLVEPDTVQAIIQEEIPKTTEPTANDTLVPLPDVRELGDKTTKLPLGEPFFELKSSIDLLHQQMDSLKRVISVYEKGKGAMPTIDEELLNLIKVPQLRHRIELQNGTIVNGEIIQEDDYLYTNSFNKEDLIDFHFTCNRIFPMNFTDIGLDVYTNNL